MDVHGRTNGDQVAADAARIREGGSGTEAGANGERARARTDIAPTCGSLFSGIGLLDCGLHLAGFRHAWLCESDEWRRGVLGARFPGVPVFDDIRTLRGQTAADADGSRADAHAAASGPRSATRQRAMGAERVDLIAGGFPCRGISGAGKREGFGHPETVLWREMARTVGELRPRYVLVENVADLLVLHDGELWSEVVGTLASFGYDVRWDCVPAGAVGAPHLRDRVFAIATQSPGACAERNGSQRGPQDGRTDVARGCDRAVASAGEAAAGGGAVAVDWGEYAPAIHRWEAVHGPAPEPLVRRVDDGDAKLQRVRARVDRSEMRTQRQRLSALGDGVHVYVAYLVGLAIREHMRTGAWDD